MGMYCAIRPLSAEHCRLLLDNPDGMEDLLDDEATAPALSLEKAWHGLHFLLTGSAWEGSPPLNFLLGGEPIGADLGYGPARILRPTQVEQLDAALSALSDDQLWSRFDPDAMVAAEIYPGSWDEPEEDLREEYLDYFHELKRLVREARVGGKGLLMVLS